MSWNARRGRTTVVYQVRALVMSAVKALFRAGGDGAPVFSYPVKRAFRVKDIAGEDRVLPDDPAVGRSRVPVSDLSELTGRVYGCRPALSVRQEHHRSRMQGMESSAICSSVSFGDDSCIAGNIQKIHTGNKFIITLVVASPAYRSAMRRPDEADASRN